MPPYWWTEETRELRAKCLKERRLMQGAHKTQNRNPVRTFEAEETYKNAKRHLGKEIQDIKNKHWKQLCQKIDNNPWEEGYKVSLKSLKQNIPGKLLEHKHREAVEILFPKHPPWKWIDKVATPQR